jgi:hypothetical protein
VQGEKWERSGTVLHRSSTIMAGLVPAIHVGRKELMLRGLHPRLDQVTAKTRHRDARNKCGHD